MRAAVAAVLLTAVLLTGTAYAQPQNTAPAETQTAGTEITQQAEETAPETQTPEKKQTQTTGQDIDIEITPERETTENDINTEIDITLDALDLQQMQNQYDADGLFGQSSLRDIIAMAAKGELPMNAWDILKLIGSRFFTDLQKNASFLIKIVVLAIIMSLLGAIGPQKLSGEVSKLCGMVIYLVVAGLIAQSMVSVMNIGYGAIRTMIVQIESIFPVMITLMVAMGSVTSAGIFQPAMALLTGAVGTFIQKVILPLVLVYGILTLVKNTSDRVQIKSLAQLVKKAAQWLLGAVFVVFLGVTALQGLGGGVYDGVTLRTAKFAIDKMVPIVGGMFSDTVDTLIGCSLVVKNGVGIAGLLMIASSTLAPVLNLAAMSFIYKLAAAVIEPFGEKAISNVLEDMSTVFTLMYVVVLTVGAMMFIMISLLINAGNMNVMLR